MVQNLGIERKIYSSTNSTPYKTNCTFTRWRKIQRNIDGELRNYSNFREKATIAEYTACLKQIPVENFIVFFIFLARSFIPGLWSCMVWKIKSKNVNYSEKSLVIYEYQHYQSRVVELVKFYD